MDHLHAAIQHIQGLLEPWQVEAMLRMLSCLLIGGLVGLEREFHGRPAGVRTHILVCLGCCIAILVSMHFARLYDDLTIESVIRIDPARIAYGVLGGVGFLGAGVIIKNGLSVRGLTTAASLWCVASLGLAAGAGMHVVAAGGTALTLISLLAMRKVDRLIKIKGHTYHMVRITCSDADWETIRKALEEFGAQILRITVDSGEGEFATFSCRVRFSGDRKAVEMYHAVKGCGVDISRVRVDC